MNEAEKAIKMIRSNKGVEGVIMVNPGGVPIESNLDRQITAHYTYNFQQLLANTRRLLKKLDPKDEALHLEVKTKKNDVLVSTAKDHFMIAIRNSR